MKLSDYAKQQGISYRTAHRKLIKIFERDDYNLIVCEHKDRLSRVGFNYIKVLLNQTGKDVEFTSSKYRAEVRSRGRDT